MMSQKSYRWTLLVAANALLWGVLSFYQITDAAPQSARQPFGNAVEQRASMVQELREIKALLREQNSLLRAAMSDDKLHAKPQG